MDAAPQQTIGEKCGLDSKGLESCESVDALIDESDGCPSAVRLSGESRRMQAQVRRRNGVRALIRWINKQSKLAISLWRR